jgi:hypothetical protein
MARYLAAIQSFVALPEHAERIGAPVGLVEHQRPSIAVELLGRLDPGVNRCRLGREHEARQAEAPPGDHWSLASRIAATHA